MKPAFFTWLLLLFQSLSGGVALTGQANLLPVFGPATIQNQEGKTYSLSGSTVEFPDSDAAIFSCTATGGASCPTVTSLHLLEDDTTPINCTILVSLGTDGVSLASAGETMTLMFNLYVENSGVTGLRTNGASSGGQCTNCVTGDGSVSSTQAICSVATAAPCTSASPGFISQAVSTCSTGAGNCPIIGQSGASYARGVKYFTTLTIVMNSGASGTVTPATVGMHFN